jgi:hypothetical protein
MKCLNRYLVLVSLWAWVTLSAFQFSVSPLLMLQGNARLASNIRLL